MKEDVPVVLISMHCAVFDINFPNIALAPDAFQPHGRSQL